MCAIIEIGGEQPRIGRHDRARHHRARILQVIAMPIVGIFAADARQIGAVALRAPLERVVVHAFGGERVMSVTLDLVAQRADHLRMAEIAALADIDVAAGEFERRVGPHAVGGLDRAAQIEQRHDLDQAADRDDDQNADQKEDRVAFEDPVLLPQRRRHERSSYSAGARLAAGASATPRIDRPPHVVGHDQRADQEQRAAERADDVVRMHRLRPSR